MPEDQDGQVPKKSGFDSAAYLRDMEEASERVIPIGYKLAQTVLQKVDEFAPITNQKSVERGYTGEPLTKYAVFAKDDFTTISCSIGAIDKITLSDIQKFDDVPIITIMANSDGSPYSYDPDDDDPTAWIVLGLEMPPFIADLEGFRAGYYRRTKINLLNKKEQVAEFLKEVKDGNEDYLYEVLDEEACTRLLSLLTNPELAQHVISDN